MHDDNDVGIPTMGPLAAEFQTTLQGMPGLSGVGAFVTAEQRDALKERLGIDLTHEDFQKNLERMMEVLMTAQQFCKTSAKAEFQEALETVEAVIAGVKKFILQKCTEGTFAHGDETVVTLYRRFYQSLATRSRGLAPPWVFTTNYDLFNERAMDRSGIPYSNDLITSPAFIVLKATNEFKDKTTAINQLWQTDFTFISKYLAGACSTSARSISWQWFACKP